MIGFAAAAAMLSFTVRRFNEQAGQGLAVAAAALIMLSVLAAFTGILTDLRSLLELGGVLPETLSAAVKAVGIAYAAQLSASVCRDLGENSLAVSCELVGRMMLVLLAFPIVRSIAEALINLIDSAI